MDLALQVPAVAWDSQNAEASSKYIIRIENSRSGPHPDYIQENIYFSTLNLEDAIRRLESDSLVPDAILINPNCISDAVTRLRAISQKKTIPIILYTARYDKSVRPLAFSIGADDYCYGAMSPAFFRRLNFIKKVKTYKNERGNRPYTARHAEQVPHVELWSMKRAFDITVSAVALLMLFPLCLLIALIIKLESRGPVFYISKRAGTGYKIFDFYKFRTMRVGADAELAQLAHLNQYGENAQGVFFKIKDDPRITRFGQFLRNTSLDEIPQLLNVLIGDMSLVGNRPLDL